MSLLAPNELYPRSTIENWLAAYNLARANGLSLEQLVGFQHCRDGCGLKRDRWDRLSINGRDYFQCRECHRFIGWIREETHRG